ncbi:MAG: hypothetical protein AAF191_10930, partial [Verrucomicrobiota bacterium]
VSALLVHAQERDELPAHLELDEREILEFLQEELPEAFEDLRNLRQEDRREYEEALDYIREVIFDYRELRRGDPEQADLFLDIERLDYLIHRLADLYLDDRSSRESRQRNEEMRDLITERFELRHEFQLAELEALEREVEELHELLIEEEENKEEIIEEELAELLHQRED